MFPDRVLLVHNRYLQRGGEDVVFETEKRLLKERGHQVFEYVEDNAHLLRWWPPRVAAHAIWSVTTYRRVRALLAAVKPDVVHFHNTFAMVSPSAYYAARAAGAPIVQTLHNYRLGCPAGAMYRNGSVCEECVRRRVKWPAVWRGCYHSSRVHSAAVAGMVFCHFALRTWQRVVDVYIALSHFARSRHILGGLPADKIVVKPNFVYPDTGPGRGEGDYALFVGRLCEEKGVHVLAMAWRALRIRVPLRIVGTGPLADLVANLGRADITWLGAKSHSEVLSLMKSARFLVMPSLQYENFPLALAEAFCAGLPAIVSAHGAMKEIVDHGRTGLHFPPSDYRGLASQVEWAATHPEALDRMRVAARTEFEERYSAEANYKMLLQIYSLAADRRVRRRFAS